MIIDGDKSSSQKSGPCSPRPTFDGARGSLSSESAHSNFVARHNFGSFDGDEEVGEVGLSLYSPRGKVHPHTVVSSCEYFRHLFMPAQQFYLSLPHL